MMTRYESRLHNISKRLFRPAVASSDAICSTNRAQTRDYCTKQIIDTKRMRKFAPHSLQIVKSCSSGSNSSDDDDKNTESMAANLIATFNSTVASHADISLWTYLFLRVGTWYSMAFAYSYVPGIGPELAVGYLLAKFTGKLRQPANLSLAALIQYQYPILGTIKASALIGLVKRNTANTEEKPKIIIKIEEFLDWISGPVDKYGFSYFIASKINLGLLVMGTGYAVKYGIDISPTLTYMGISDGMQTGAGAMGAATLTNVLLTPVHLGLLMYVVPQMVAHGAPLVAEFEKKYKELDEQVKRDREEIKRKMDDMDKKS